MGILPGTKGGKSPAEDLTCTRDPLGSFHTRPPAPLFQPVAESRFLVPGPSAAGSSSTDIRAAGGRREPAEPKPRPSERTGGRARRSATADLGGSAAPATLGLAASPEAGHLQVLERGQGGRPAFHRGRRGVAAGPCSLWKPSPEKERGCRGWLDSAWAGLGGPFPHLPLP